jgi:NADPH-dependent F420 reductase
VEDKSMRIGIFGVGSVGSALGRGFAKRGYEVMFGVRNPADPKVVKLLEEAEGSRAGAVAEAAAFGEVVVLAIPWDSAQEVIRSAGGLAGKIVFDCINPLKPDFSGLAVGHTTSAAEQVAAWAPQARVVKVFNNTGAGNMADPIYGEEPATLFYCGDDEEAKAVAARLAADLGFDPVDAGPLTQARLLEPLAMLWISLAYHRGLGRNIAFKLMRR